MRILHLVLIGMCLGIIQRDNLITFNGYKVPYRNGHFYFEEQTKITNENKT